MKEESNIPEAAEILKYNIDIGITEKESCINSYQNQYTQKLHSDFIESREEKKHNINSHANWFNKKIKYNHLPEKIEVINKWKICTVDYGMNIGTEINGVRPSLVFKKSAAKYGEDFIVIPITSDEETKSIDEYDIKLSKDPNNGLKNNSILKTRQMRCVSKKRLSSKKGSQKINILGEVKDENKREEIQIAVRGMLGI